MMLRFLITSFLLLVNFLLVNLFALNVQKDLPGKHRIHDLVEYTIQNNRTQPAAALDSAKLAYEMVGKQSEWNSTINYALAQSFFYNDQLDSAEYYYYEVFNKSECCNVDTLLAKVYVGLAAISRNRGKYKLADSLLRLALPIASEQADSVALMGIYRTKAIILKRQHKASESLKFYLQALEIANAKDDLQMQANMLNGISGIYKIQKDYDQAKGYLMKSFRFFVELDDKVGQTNALNNIGDLYLRQSNWDSAVHYLQKARKLIQEVGLVRGEGITSFNLGICYRELGQYDLAKGFFLRSAEVFANLGDLRTEIFPVNGLIETYRQLGEYEKSIQLAEQVMAKAENEHIAQIVIDLSFSLYEIYSERSQFKIANQYLVQHYQFKDSLLNVETSKQLLEMESKYQAKEQQQEIKMLQQKNEIKDLQISQQRVGILIAVSFLLVILSIGYFYMRQRQLVSDSKRLTLEQRLLRAQMNPHFIFNALNSIQSYITSDRSTEAVVYLAKYGELTRDTLEVTTQDWIPLEKELSMIKNYLVLEEARFQKSLQLKTQLLMGDAEEIVIPPMILQPFIENAVKHGFKNKDGGTIDLKIQEIDNCLKVEICDDGVGLLETEQKHKSRAIEITNERLAGLSKKWHYPTVQISSRKSPFSGVIVRFDIPLRHGI